MSTTGEEKRDGEGSVRNVLVDGICNMGGNSAPMGKTRKLQEAFEEVEGMLEEGRGQR